MYFGKYVLHMYVCVCVSFLSSAGQIINIIVRRRGIRQIRKKGTYCASKFQCSYD